MHYHYRFKRFSRFFHVLTFLTFKKLSPTFFKSTRLTRVGRLGCRRVERRFDCDDVGHGGRDDDVALTIELVGVGVNHQQAHFTRNRPDLLHHLQRSGAVATVNSRNY